MATIGFARIWYVSLAALLLVGQALVGTTASAQVLGPVRFEMGSAHLVPLGDTVTLPLVFDNDSTGFELGGLYLVLHYDNSALSLLDVETGPLFNECGWELFNYGSDTTGVIEMIAVGDVSAGTPGPYCYFEGAEEDTFALLRFVVSSDTAYACASAPVEFYWRQCSDNAHSSVSGLELYSSDVVVRSDGSWYYGGDTLPTFEGAPDNCVNGPAGNNNRAIDYVGGYVDILCNDVIDQRGDLNLNDIANEIADWVVYNHYFYYGLGAFTIDVQAQVAASDVNADGLVLTMRDVGYLWRIIIGDALPFPKRASAPAIDTAVFVQDVLTHEVSLEYADSLVQVFMTFSGEIEAQAADSSINVDYVHLPGQTRMMVSIYSQSPESGHLGIFSGPLFTYTGSGTLSSADVADWQDGIVPTRIKIGQGSAGCGDADGNGLINVTDVVYLVEYVFAGGAAPEPLSDGDVDCDGFVNITDAVYLLSYIFDGGTVPCNDCP